MKTFPIMINDYAYDRQRRTSGKVREAGGYLVVVALPWDMIAVHEDQARKNHGQSLERLAERGGLSSCEALAVLTGKGWNDVTNDEAEAHRILVEHLLAFRELCAAVHLATSGPQIPLNPDPVQS